MDQNEVKRESLILYDSAGGINLIHPGNRTLDHHTTMQFSQPLILGTVNGNISRRYPILKLYLILEKNSIEYNRQEQDVIKDILCYPIQAYETTFPLAKSSPNLFDVKLRCKGERFAEVPLAFELETLPAVCLGIQNLKQHPVEIPESEIPTYIKTKFPNAVVFRSKITNRIILAGNVGEPTHRSRTVSNLTLPLENAFLSDFSSTVSQTVTPDSPVHLRVRQKTRGRISWSDPLVRVKYIPAENKGIKTPRKGWYIAPKNRCDSTVQLSYIFEKSMAQEVIGFREQNELTDPGKEETPLRGDMYASDLVEGKEAHPLRRDIYAANPGETLIDDVASDPDIQGRTRDQLANDTHGCVNPCVHKLFSTESETFRANVFLYDLYIADMKEVFNDHGLEALEPGLVGCSKCDKRHTIMMDTTLANNSLLARQLKWMAFRGGKTGIFAVNRLFRASIQTFPTCQKTCTFDTLNLVGRLKGKPSTAKELTYRVQKDYLNGNCCFLTSAEEAQLRKGHFFVDKQRIKPIFLPQHVVFNVLSKTTPCRLVLVPNRAYPQPEGKPQTYNDQLRDYSLNMNNIEFLQLSQTLALETLAIDVSDAFKSLANSYASSLRCMTMALKSTKGGLPTYISYGSEEMDMKNLRVLRWDRCSYGIADLPKLYSTALALSTAEFKKHAPNKISEDLLEEVKACLLGLSYCDDLQVSSLHKKSVEFAAMRGINPPKYNERDSKMLEEDPHYISEEYCIEYDTFLAKISHLYLYEVTKVMVEVLAHSNFYLKTIETRDKTLRALLNSPEVLIKNKAATLPKMERPSASSVHKEAGKVSKEFLNEVQLEIDANPDFIAKFKIPAVHQSPVYLTQLSRHFHEDGQVSLKTRYLNLDGTHKNPRCFVHSYLHFLDYIKNHKVVMNKRFLFSITGQMYDCLGISLMGPKSCIKSAIHKLHSRAGTTVDWEDLVGGEVEKIIHKSIEWYFLAANQTFKRANLYQYQEAGHLLLSQSDAGGSVHAVMCFIISYVNINGIYRAKSQLLYAKPWVNNVGILSIPHLELLALSKSINITTLLHSWLEKLGISIQPCNILITTDSRVSLIQCRSRAALHTKKTGHLVAKIALKLLEGSLSPYYNLYFHDQKRLFHVDNLTKVPADTIQAAEMRLRDHSWLNTNPKSWSHLTRGGQPATDNNLIEDLQLNKDYIEEALEIIHQFQQTAQELFTPDNPVVDHTIQMTTTPLEIQPFSLLILRKMSHGLDAPGSATRILGRCYFYLKRLQYISHMNINEKEVIRQKLKATYACIREVFTPWCLSFYCNPPLTVAQGSKNMCATPNHHRVVQDKTCVCLPPTDMTESFLVGSNANQTITLITAPDTGLGDNVMIEPDIVLDGDEVVEDPEGALLDSEETTDGIHTVEVDYPTPLAIKANLSAEIRELVKFPWSIHSERVFEAYVLQFLCSHYRSDKPYLAGGYSRIHTTDLGFGNITHWALGRMQRSRANYGTPENTGRILLRLVEPLSVLGRLTLHTAHAYSGCHETHGVNNDKALSYIIQKGVYFRNPKRHLDSFKKNCALCTVQKAQIGKNMYRVVRTNSGPSESLSTLANSKSNLNSAIIDLAGPFWVACLNHKCKSKVWVLVLINDIGRLHLIVIQDYSSSATLQALLTFTQTFGSLQFLASDDGASFQKFQTAVSPMARDTGENNNANEEETPEDLNKIWSELMEDSPQRRLREENGSSFRKYCQNRHSCVASAERMVHVLKIFLIKCKLFKRGRRDRKPEYNLLTFQYFLSKVESLVNSRPLFMHRDMLLGINDLAVVAQICGQHTGSSGLTHKSGVLSTDAELFEKRLELLQTLTNELMTDLAHSLAPRLLELTPEHHANENGPINTHLSEGDVVLDKRNLVLTGNLTGSLAKISLLSEDNRWCVISRVKPTLLSDEAHRLCLAIKQGKKIPKGDGSALIQVGRPTTDLFLITKSANLQNKGYTTFNGGTKIFDFGLCLSKIANKQFVPLCLPPQSHCELSLEDKEILMKPNEELWPIPLLGDIEEVNQLDIESPPAPGDLLAPDFLEDETGVLDAGEEEQDNDTVIEGEHVRTKSGRLSRKPQRYGL